MTESTPLLVSPGWLAHHLTEPHLLVLDCRYSLTDPEQGRLSYEESHIPKAFYVDLAQDLSGEIQEHGGRHPLPTFKTFELLFQSFGLTPQTHVVVYDDHQFAFASRCWWLLRHFGCHQVSVLNGGFSTYQRLGFAVSNDREEKPTASTQTGLTENKKQADCVSIAEVTQRLGQDLLIDSRQRDRYRGLCEPIDPVAGHIPGAINYFWKNITTPEGYMRSPAELRTYWQPVLKQSTTADNVDLIVYCGSGVTACVNLLALEIIGVKNAKLYAGSWSDWCSYALDSNWNIIAY